MAKILLIADTNFKNNIGAYKGRKIAELEVKSAQTRRAVMSELTGAEEGIVVIACLDMIAADIARTTTSEVDSAVDYYYSQLLYKLTEKVDESDGKIAFGIVAPLFWSSHAHEVKRAMNHAFKTMKKTPMANIWCSDYLKDVNAGAGGTHLTRASADKYIGHIHDLFKVVSDKSGLGPVVFLEPNPEQQSQLNDSNLNWADDTSEAVNPLGPPEDEVSPARTVTMLSPSMLLPTRPRPELERSNTAETQARLLSLAASQPDLSRPPPTHGHQNDNRNGSEMSGGGPASLERRVGALEAQAFYNHLTTAALKEELDTEANKALLNRVTVSGVVIRGITEMSDTEKVRAMKYKIQQIIDRLRGPNQTFEVQFVRHLNKQVRGQRTSVIEVKLANEKQAKDLRSEFVKKYREMDKINITPVVRPATRVRIEIMHSVCFYMKRQDKSVIRASCLQFVPKPVVKVIRKSMAGNESTTTMSFIDCINWIKDNGLMGKMDLSKAQDRAGARFRGTMAQNFVVLD